MFEEEQKKSESEKKIDELILNQTLSISKMESNVDEERRKIGLPTIGT